MQSRLYVIYDMALACEQKDKPGWMPTPMPISIVFSDLLLMWKKNNEIFYIWSTFIMCEEIEVHHCGRFKLNDNLKQDKQKKISIELKIMQERISFGARCFELVSSLLSK